MRHKPFTALNPAFADMSTAQLIAEIEVDWMFKNNARETELAARLERAGNHWRFAGPGIVEILPLTAPLIA